MEENKKNQDLRNKTEENKNQQTSETTNKEETKIEKIKKNFSKKAKTEDKIKKLEKEIEELKNKNLMLLAEFENFRKRKEKETQEIREKTIINLVLDLLPIIDNFEMSLKMTDNKEMFIKGVEMIHKNLLNLLEENQIKEFHPLVGEEFDPISHDPIVVEDEKAEPGKVLEIVKKGYKHKDKIILPSRVKIKKQE